MTNFARQKQINDLKEELERLTNMEKENKREHETLMQQLRQVCQRKNHILSPEMKEVQEKLRKNESESYDIARRIITTDAKMNMLKSFEPENEYKLAQAFQATEESMKANRIESDSLDEVFENLLKRQRN